MEDRPDSARKVGLLTAAALVVGHTIGVGIFLTPGQFLGALASPAWTLGLWLTCGAFVLAGALTFGELANRYPRTGGLYVYLREAWGERVGFLYGWQSLLVMDPGVTAALALGLSEYLVVAWPAAAGSEKWLALGAIWALALVNMAGLKVSARTLNALTLAKVAALVAIVAGSFTVASGNWSHFIPFYARRSGAPPIGEAIGLGLAGAFYSFGGFWEASRVAEEIREPRRRLPAAFALGVGIVTALYVATTVAFLYLVPAEQMPDAAEFGRRAGRALLGASGPAVLAWIVALSVVASALALLLMAPRLYVAMSRDRLFPATLASLDPRTGAPARATAVLAALASLYVLSGSFPQIVAFFLCTALVFVALAAAGVFVARRRDPHPEGFLAPGYPLTPALFVLFLVAVAAVIALARPVPAVAGFALVLAGLPVYGLLAARGSIGPSISRGGRS